MREMRHVILSIMEPTEFYLGDGKLETGHNRRYTFPAEVWARSSQISSV